MSWHGGHPRGSSGVGGLDPDDQAARATLRITREHAPPTSDIICVFLADLPMLTVDFGIIHGIIDATNAKDGTYDYRNTTAGGPS
jgi:hypothetical protein